MADFDYYQNCVHCGLCLPKCPTYVELGDENDSPRGRIYLMQALDTGRLKPSQTIQHHLDLCLDCRACETVCPSGVEYGHLIESYRTHADGDRYRRGGWRNRMTRWLTLHVFPYPQRTRLLIRAARLARATGFFEFIQASGLARDHAAALRFPDIIDEPSPDDRPIPAHSSPSAGPTDSIVGLFSGCVGESLLGRTNRATHRVLLRNRCEVHCPARQVCCGAIHYHAGDIARAGQFARTNIEIFEGLGEHLDAIVVNVAGCGLMLKQYDELLSGDPQFATRARRFVEKVKDISEFLIAHGFDKPRHAIRARVTYHHACHLCHGQKIWHAPRRILETIPGLKLIELKEAEFCCGAAGSHSMTEPQMANRLARRKLDQVAETDSQILAVANAGCILHLRQHVATLERELTVAHPIDLLDHAYAP